MTDSRWTRDEIGEYHDGEGNLIGRDSRGWWVIVDATMNVRPGDDRYGKLSDAKTAIAERTGGE